MFLKARNMSENAGILNLENNYLYNNLTPIQLFQLKFKLNDAISQTKALGDNSRSSLKNKLSSCMNGPHKIY